MSDSEDSTVTYTEVSSPFEGLSDIGSLGVEGPPMMPEDPYAYIVAAFQAPPSLDYVPGPKEPEQAPPLPEFVLESDDDDDDDDDDDESSDNDEDDDDVEEDEDEEKEEHPAPADSILPPPVHHTTTRISIPIQAPTPFWSEAEIDRLLAIPSPPPSPLSPWASVAMLRAVVPSTYILTPQSETPPSGTPSLLPIPLPTSSPPLILPSMSHRADVLEVTLPPQKRLCIALGLRFEVSESSSAPTARPTGGFRADYGFVATLDDEIRRDPKKDVGYGITDTWDKMLVGMSAAPSVDELNMLHRDRRDHARTARLMETEAKLYRQAWVQSMDASDTACAEVVSLLTTVLA
nr:hypothetical protein [Tanacetum cinerariifolium]